MTKPTITYHHEFLDDCNNVTGWSETEVGLPSTMTVDKDDYFIIEGTCDSAADEYVYYAKDVTNILVGANTTLLVRWKTSAASNGLQARIRLTYTAGAPTDITLGFSTTWTVSKISLAAEVGRIIDTVLLFADDNPDTVAAGTFQVYFDFILICRGVFAFPNTQYGIEFTPPPHCALIPILRRVTDITQNLGSESATFTASCNLDISNATNDWKRPQGTLSPKTDYVQGEVFIEIAHATYTEPWQWLDTGKQQFKVTLDTLRLPEHSDSHSLDLTFKECSRSSKSDESYVERFGLNLT